MQAILRNLNYDNSNFVNDNIQIVFPEIEKFRRQIYETPTENQSILDIISLLIELTDSVKIQSSSDLEKENGHEWLFNAFLKHLEPDKINNDNIEQILRIFGQLTRLKNSNRNAVRVFSSLFRLLKNKNQQSKINDQMMIKIIQILTNINFKFERKYIEAVMGPSYVNELSQTNRGFIRFQDDQFRSQYRFAVEDFFDNLGEERFTVLLPHIQAFFE